MKFKVRVIANSKKESVQMTGTELKVHLTAQPIKGKANKALIHLLSKNFSVKKSNIKINKGLTSNVKEVEIK